MTRLLVLLFAFPLIHATVTDLAHMQSCVLCVRESVLLGDSLIDRLTHQADGQIETVILYLLRACYFRMTRSKLPYQIPDLLMHATSSVPGFTDREFTILRDITRIEAFSRLDSKTQNGGNVWSYWDVPLSVVLVTFVTLPLFLWGIKTYRTVT